MKFVVKYKSKRASNCKWHCFSLYGKPVCFTDYQSALHEALSQARINDKCDFAVFQSNGVFITLVKAKEV